MNNKNNQKDHLNSRLVDRLNKRKAWTRNRIDKANRYICIHFKNGDIDQAEFIKSRFISRKAKKSNAIDKHNRKICIKQNNSFMKTLEQVEKMLYDKIEKADMTQKDEIGMTDRAYLEAELYYLTMEPDNYLRCYNCRKKSCNSCEYEGSAPDSREVK